MAPSTPPPPISEEFAALTITSTLSLVMSPLITSILADINLFIFIDMKMKTSLLAIVVVFFAVTAKTQSKVQKYIADQSNQHRWLNEYTQFLSIPNVLGDSVNILRNANRISAMLNQLGVKSELLLSGKPNSAPVVYGSVNAGAPITIAFYAHYDGQPVNPKQQAQNSVYLKATIHF